MKTKIILIALFLNKLAFAQVTNISAGVWSNPNIWSNHMLPVDTTDIILNFDLVVDINSSCRSLQTNFHNVTINAGVAFGVNGVDVNAIDVDGNIYSTVLIGTQHWMARNLEVTHYRNGDPIPQVQDASAWGSLTTGAWCYYENSTANGIEYGKLYNWYAVNDPRGLAPQGWRVPADADWGTIFNFLGAGGPNTMQAGGRMKERGTKHWDPPNSGDNSSRFTGLPGGYREAPSGLFFTLRYMGWFWSSTPPGGHVFYLYNSEDYLDQYNNPRRGYSVRCVKN